MATLSQLLSIAEKEIGVFESPPNSNKVKYNTWYYKREVSGKDYPWCMVFCQWVFNQAGVAVPIRTASCTAMYEAAKKHNRYVNKNHLQPGDLILYSFGRTTNTSDHCGILKSIDGIKIEVIEGNTATANDTNGGTVMLRRRTTENVVGAFRPIFDKEVEDMTIDDFINNLTQAQAQKIVDKARTRMASENEPTWSKQEGYWKKASETTGVNGKKVVDGTRPEDILKRDELISILGRLGLIDG